MKVAHISGHDCHAMNERCGSNEGVTIRARIWHVQHCASLCNDGIYRKNATRECAQNMPVHPGAKDSPLGLVAPFDEKNSYL